MPGQTGKKEESQRGFRVKYLTPVEVERAEKGLKNFSKFEKDAAQLLLEKEEDARVGWFLEENVLGTERARILCPDKEMEVEKIRKE